MKRSIIFVLSLVVFASTASAQVAWKYDKAHSSVGFKVKHLVISTVNGKFGDFDIAFTSKSRSDFSGAQVKAVLKTVSINTDNAKRDNHLRSDDFLNAEKYPDITFTSRSFTKTGKNTYAVSGDLTIRDVTKPVDLTATLGGSADFMGNTIAAFHITGAINRFDFGVKWSNKMDTGKFIVSEKVTFDFNIEFTTKSDVASGSGK